MKMSWGNRLFVYFFMLHLSCNLINASVIDYIWPKKSGIITDLESLPSVPYELSERDEKFLEEARKLDDRRLSDLDLCHHRVLLTLKSKCNDMNSEQIGKLAVMLLNCQSYSEGRPIYQCNDNMSLKECTTDMNGDTWNAYHLMTNRAKAVCMSVLQDQFRGLTELTVNKLMSTAHEQLKLSKLISENQNELHEFSNTAFEEISVKNSKVMSQQNDLLQMTDIHRAKVESNLKELTKERGLIRAGQMEVFSFLEKIKSQIDENFNQLELHTKRSKLNHDAVSTDLEILRDHILGIVEQMEVMSNHLVAQNKLSIDQQELTIQNLGKMNSTVLGLTNVINNLLLNFEKKLAWLSKNEFLEAHSNLLGIHLIYLVLGMIVLSFLFADMYTRLVFVLTIICDFIAVIFELYEFDNIAFSITLASLLSGNILLKNIIKYYAQRKKQSLYQPKIVSNEVDVTDNGKTTSQFSKNTVDKITILRQRVARASENLKSRFSPQKERTTPIQDESSEDDEYYAQKRGSTPQKDISPSPSERRYDKFERSMTPDIARVLRTEGIYSMNNNRVGTPFTHSLKDRVQCEGITKKGARCLNAAIMNKTLCRLHVVSH